MVSLRKDFKTARRVVRKLMHSRSARRELARRGPELPRPAAGSIQIAVYFADATVNMYQIRLWYAPLAELAREHPGATFATMGLSIPVDQLIYMLQRIQYWGEHFGLKFEGKVDTPSDNPLGFGPATTTILGKYPDVDYIVTFNDQSAVAAATTVATSGKHAKIVTPNAAMSITRDAMRAGRLDLVYRVPWTEQGVQSVWAAYDALTKQGVPLPTFITVPGYMVTQHDVNAASWLQ